MNKMDPSETECLLVSDSKSSIEESSVFEDSLEQKHTFETELLLVGDSRSSINNVKRCDVTNYEHASILSRLIFSWMTPLLAMGHNRSLELDDVPHINPTNSVYQALPVLYDKLTCLEHNSSNKSANSSKITGLILAKALFLSVWKEIIWSGFLGVLFAITSFVCPYLIDTFVHCLNGRGKFNKKGYILVSIFFVANIVQSLLLRHLRFKLEQVGMRFRAATSALIYNKGLRLSSQSKQNQTSGGELLNLVAVDVETIDKFTASLHDSWLIILQVILGSLIIFKGLGIVACFGALAATALVMLSNFIISTWEETYQEKLMESKDKRMKMTSEVLRNMRLLKLQGWDTSFLSMIFQIREVESQWLRKYLYTSALMNFVINIATTFVGLITFGLCVLIGIPLETGKILSALATINVLEGPIVRLPVVISLLIQVKVSLRRIAAFLCLDEHQVDSFYNIPLGATDTAIEIIQGNFTWDISLPNPTMQNISLKVSRGMKVSICGTVGSGKSSLLSCILGEMPRISGDIKLCGTKAFVAQTPWIQNGTIRDNILFGKEIDVERYDKILEACALNKDLERLSFGDQTIIGERGVNLSGGQKQRIQIARALYHDADIFLLDDPFSAVDAHTRSHLYKEVLHGLLRQKTVVYVTHQVEFSIEADLILVMKDGRIARCGKYDDILVPGCDFNELVGAQKAAMSALLDTSPASDIETQVKSGGNHDTNIRVVPEEGPTEANVETSLTAGQLIQEEEKESGSVGFPVYWTYITLAYAGGLALLILIAQILSEIFRVGSNYWLAWASPTSEDVKSAVSGSALMTVYVSLAIGISLSTLLVDMSVATIGYTTATILFRKMHERIFRAPMSFFDATPSGRILNRCSADQSSVETRIPSLLEGFTSSVICLLTITGLMCTLAWQVLIVFVPVVFACIWYQRFYIPSSRELSRLKAVCRAPVIQTFAETMSGTTTIRSFGLQSKFKTTYMNVLDAYCRPHLHAAAALKWLMLRIDAFSSITFAFLLVLLVSFDGQVDSAIAGIAVTYALRLNNELLGLVWNSSYCETEMISVERILQYLSIPSEAPLIVEANRQDNLWPSSGEICVDNLHVRYAPHMPLVLQGITCTFPGKMKTGIVGRTGSGKSTLVQTLFRIVEPTKGRILIDGIDIALIGLQDLRSKLAIIPQDPIMFQGTIRRNLDPLAQFTDMQLWETLDKCQLGDDVRKMEKKLDSDVIENGENWSLGQRQLVCLGRVLLKRSKILVLDEATASVDTATDNLIQQTLNAHFSHSTIITITHRIASVLDSHMILLLNNGVVEEFDTPTSLLQNNLSSFAQLVVACTSNGGRNTNSTFRRRKL